MDQLAHVVIVLSRCSRSKDSFGIRLEEKSPSQWCADWAFAVKETLGQKEGYDKNEIKGSILLDDQYPGCPHCNNASFVLCSACNKVSCYDGTGSSTICPWCNVRRSVSGSIQVLRAGTDY